MQLIVAMSVSVGPCGDQLMALMDITAELLQV
jgi:hypothetical protein